MQSGNLQEEFKSFLKEIPNNVENIDPELIRSQLRLAGVISDEDDERIKNEKVKSDRQVELFLKLLPLKDPVSVISALYRISHEKKYDTLRTFIEEKCNHFPIWSDVIEKSRQTQLDSAQSYFSKSVKSAIQYLKSVYKTDTETMQDQWRKLLCPYADDFTFANMFIDLEIVKEGSRKHQKIYCYSDLFGIKGRKIVLEGDPGMGKSTYLHKIAYDWAMGDEWLNEAFDLVILIRLGDLNAGDTFEQFLGNLVPTQHVTDILQFMSMPENHHKILFILDAYDEFHNKDTCSEISNLVDEWKLDKERSFRNSTLLISSRIPQSQHIKNCQLLVRTVGFQASTVLDKFQDKIDNLKMALEDENQKELFKNPLFLGLGAALSHIPEELYDLINNFCIMAVERYLTKIETPTVNVDFDEIWNKVTQFVSKLAFVISQPRLLTSPPVPAVKDLICIDPMQLTSGDCETFALCCNIGLLCRQKQIPPFLSPGSGRRRNNLPTFPHQLFLEFFAAMYVANNSRLITDLDEQITRKRDRSLVKTFAWEFRTPFSYFLSHCECYKQLVLHTCVGTVQKLFDHTRPYVSVNCPFIYKPDLVPSGLFDYSPEIYDGINFCGNSDQNYRKDGIFILSVLNELLTKDNQQNIRIWYQEIKIDKNIMQCLLKYGTCRVRFSDGCGIDENNIGEFNNWLSEKDCFDLFDCNELANSLTFNKFISLSTIKLGSKRNIFLKQYAQSNI